MNFFDNENNEGFLHDESLCDGLENGISRMKLILDQDPTALNRFTIKRSFVERSFTMRISPLISACHVLHLNCVKFLLGKGAAIQTNPPDDISIVYHTMFEKLNYLKHRKQCLEIIQFILVSKDKEERIYPDLNQSHRYDEFFRFLDFHCNEVVKLLLEFGEVSPNVLEFEFDLLERNTPIIAAIEAKNVEAMKILILYGAHVRNFVRIGHNWSAVPCHIQKFNSDCDHTLIDMLRLFKCFGGKLLSKQEDDEGHMICVLDLLQNSELQETINEMTSNTLTLRELSRLAIWKTLGTDYWSSVRLLEIPIVLQNFLMLDDF